MKYFVLVALALPVAFWSASATQPVASAPVAAAKTLKVDGVHSSIVFRCMHLNTAWAYGRFDKFDGNIVLDGANSKVELEIDPASVNTANGGRDDHLRGPDFFDVKQFPKASFKSTKVVPDGESKMKVDGDLTLHGVTKPISFVVEKTGSVDDPKFGKKTGFHATLVVKRSEFGITYMKGGLGEDVEFMVSLEANEG